MLRLCCKRSRDASERRGRDAWNSLTWPTRCAVDCALASVLMHVKRGPLGQLRVSIRPAWGPVKVFVEGRPKRDLHG